MGGRERPRSVDADDINTGYVAAGIKTVDEARADIGLGPIAGGDKSALMQRLFNPVEPRDERGRWTTSGGSTKKPKPGSAYITPAFLEEPPELPKLEEAPEPIKPVEPEKLPDPEPPSSMQKPRDNPNTPPGPARIPPGLTREEEDVCRQQWKDAEEYCYDREGTPRYPDRQGWIGRDVDECMMGMVDYKCGGSHIVYDTSQYRKPYRKKPRKSKKPKQKPDLEA